MTRSTKCRGMWSKSSKRWSVTYYEIFLERIVVHNRNALILHCTHFLQWGCYIWSSFGRSTVLYLADNETVRHKPSLLFYACSFHPTANMVSFEGLRVLQLSNVLMAVHVNRKTTIYVYCSTYVISQFHSSAIHNMYNIWAIC